MGADQSTGAKLSRDDGTSYSIGRPIGGDAVKVSPRPEKKKSPNVPSTSTKGHHIVVVAKGKDREDIDEELEKLQSIPTCFPILQNTVGLPNANEAELFEKMDTKAIMALVARYQDHLKQCSEAVAFDQNALCVRIKEVDLTVQQLYNALQERQKRFAKYAEQIQKVQDMHSTLNKIKMNVEQTLPIMERLNSVLPPEDQLEPFSMKPTPR